MSLAAPGHVALAVEGAIAALRLESPARRNAMSTAMWTALAGHCAQLARRADVRVIVVRGGGDAIFSAGADISEFESQRGGDANAGSYDDAVESGCTALEAVPQTTIALIRGACVGAGNSIAAACDLRIAADDAFFLHTAARLGLGYDVRGIARLIRAYGLPATRLLLLGGTRLAAMRAHQLGAIDEIAAPGEVEAAAASLAERASRHAPLTVRAAKAALRALAPASDPALVEAARELARQADASDDYAEGRAAFREKREPRFEGR